MSDVHVDLETGSFVVHVVGCAPQHCIRRVVEVVDAAAVVVDAAVAAAGVAHLDCRTAYESQLFALMVSCPAVYVVAGAQVPLRAACSSACQAACSTGLLACAVASAESFHWKLRLCRFRPMTGSPASVTSHNVLVALDLEIRFRCA